METAILVMLTVDICNLLLNFVKADQELENVLIVFKMFRMTAGPIRPDVLTHPCLRYSVRVTCAKYDFISFS